MDSAELVRISGEGPCAIQYCSELMIKLTSQIVVADKYIESYYKTLQSHQGEISSYYASIPEDGQRSPILFSGIIFNGTDIPDPQEFQRMITEEMSPIHYEIDGYDCQVLNENVDPEGLFGLNLPKEKAMSFLLMVTGGVRAGELKHSEMRPFSETLVLVPSPHFSATKKGQPATEWLISEQTFRYI